MKRQYNRIGIVLKVEGIERTALAKHMNVAKDTVDRWCSNEQQPNIAKLFKISSYTNRPVADLLSKNREIEQEKTDNDPELIEIEEQVDNLIQQLMEYKERLKVKG